MTVPTDSWFLKYIRKCTDEDLFYTSFGKFVHKLIEKFYKNGLSNDDLVRLFLTNFSSEVKGERPSENIVKNYINSGVNYFRNMKPFDYNMVAVEKRIDFDIEGIPFVGFIDFIGEKNGEYCIIDNKSRDLRPRSNRSKPTAKDKELDLMLRQLYIYSAAIYEEYGKFPKTLCFNCFRTNKIIEEEFDIDTYKSTVDWVKSTVEELKNVDDFHPYIDYFMCKYLCGVHKECCYAADFKF